MNLAIRGFAGRQKEVDLSKPLDLSKWKGK